jgi:toxin YoeB
MSNCSFIPPFWHISPFPTICRDEPKITALIKDIQRQPYEGLGKPEELKWELSGYWSRRIDEEHRLVYRITDNNEDIEIVGCKYHYTKKP